MSGSQFCSPLFKISDSKNARRVSAYWELRTLGGTFLIAIPVAVFLCERVPRRYQNPIRLALMFPILLPRFSVGFIWRFFYALTIGLVNIPVC